MSQLFYVNKNSQSNGDHEVHISSCSYLPDLGNLQYLGFFVSCRDALNEARKHYSDVDGCFYCCKACHRE